MRWYKDVARVWKCDCGKYELAFKPRRQDDVVWKKKGGFLSFADDVVEINRVPPNQIKSNKKWSVTIKKEGYRTQIIDQHRFRTKQEAVSFVEKYTQTNP